MRSDRMKSAPSPLGRRRPTQLLPRCHKNRRVHTHPQRLPFQNANLIFDMRLLQDLFVAFALSAVAVHQIMAMPQPTPAPKPVTLSKRACSADNCLRAVRNNVKSAIPFCSTYTTDATATIPTWAANCQENPTRITSACNCLAVGKIYQDCFS